MRSTRAMWFVPGTMALSAVSAAGFGGKYLREATLIAADQRAEDALGYSIAMSGSTIVGGAMWQDTGGENCGAVYLYERTDGDWIQHAKLLPDDPTASLHFGYSVAISGETLLVGAFGDSRPGGHASGSAYVFTRVDGAWTQQAKLVAPDATPNALFGLSVAIRGDLAVIGASQQNNEVGNGKVYAFQRTGTSWQYVATLVALDGEIGDAFGASVSVSEEHILIGAPQDDNVGRVDAGAAYLFSRVGGSWVQSAKLIGSHAGGDAKFGQSVAIGGETLLIGGFQESYDGLEYAGAVYVFDRVGSHWEQTARLTPHSAASEDYFGYSVAICGDELLAGAYGRDVGAADAAGAVFRFRRNAGAWSQVQQFSELNRDRRLGSAVALGEEHAVLGHMKDAYVGMFPGMPAGAIWVYSTGALAPPTCPADLNGNGVVDLSDLAILLASFGLVCP